MDQHRRGPDRVAAEAEPTPAALDEWDDARTIARARRGARARLANGRIRGVDPATCDHDYSAAELEFLRAIEAYKQASGRKFPALSEVLGVLKSLGYSKPVAVETPFGVLLQCGNGEPIEMLGAFPFPDEIP